MVFCLFDYLKPDGLDMLVMLSLILHLNEMKTSVLFTVPV